MDSLQAPVLYHLSSAQSTRVLWALEELALSHGQKFELKSYKRQRGRAPTELQKVFPLGKSPILEIPGVELYRPLNFIDNGDETKRTVVTESRLILQFLSDKYSKGEWVPATEEDRQRDSFFQEFANSTVSVIVDRITYFQIIPVGSPWIVRPLMRAIFHPIEAIFSKDIDGPLTLMERALSDETPWFSGATLGLADFNMIWPLDGASQKKLIDEKKYPKVVGWLKRVRERPAYQNARKKGGSYDLVRYEM
ncbi:hypothetical protein PISL3812_03887 [Talaromyces islandicus]|uniref:Glutathione S-transferase n=1 Tax=Talaromyces islandicus TaxID=28573 RepID=A0A0U1LUH6_TALIS|nr:hypothetical protein PISL3812_03887 [Talaromyces islandicus]